MNVGDVVTVSIIASEAGLTLTSGSINGVAVTGFTDNGAGSYSATYTVLEGHTDRAADTTIPVSFVLADTAGNVSDTFTTAISQASDAIDANSPTISSVSIADTAMNVGDVVTVSITASEAGLTLTSGSINGVAVTGFTDNGAGSYSATYIVIEGHADRAAGDAIPVSFILEDAAGNKSNTFTTAISQASDAIDANSPSISSVSIADTTMKVGDVVTVSISASEAGLTLNAGTINGVAVTNFTDNGAGNYSATYTVLEGHTDRAAGEAIPVDFVLEDAAGNASDTFTTAISQASDTIDANSPTISSVSIADTAMNVGDVVTVSITANEAGLALTSGSINGVAVTAFTDNGAGNYSATYTVVEGHTDRAAGDAIPVSFILEDTAGNASDTFTTAISQSSDAIDANSPSISAVSIPNVPMRAFDTVIFTLTVSDDGGEPHELFMRNTIPVEYTRVNSTTYQVDVIMNVSFDIPGDADLNISYTLKDAAGNYSPEFTTPISQPNDPIDATSPVISSVSIPDAVMGVGDTVTVTLTVADDAGDIYTNLIGTVGDYDLSNLTRIDSTTYTAVFTVAEGDNNIVAGDDISVALTIDDSVGNTSDQFTTSISQSGDGIDANTPTITSVSISDSLMIVGDVVTVSITASEAGLSLNTGTINGVAVTGFTDNGAGNYSATYTVLEGHTDRAAGDVIPVSFVLEDTAGNVSDAFTTAISQTNDPIDANGPVITGLSIPNAPMKIGDIVTLTITVEDDGGDIYPTSGGYGPITRINSTTYTLQFEITEGNADIAAGDDFPFELEIIDSAGNASNFFEGVITQDNDPIDANRPTISAVSIPDVAMSVGDAVTVSITAGEAGLTLTSGTINGVAVTGFTDNGAGNYSATYTVLEGHTDRAAGDAIPVSFVLEDTAGNVSDAFTTAISQTNDPIDANGPVITGLSIPNAPMKIGDIVTLTITVEDDGGDIYPTSGGYGPITRINSTTYTLQFEITEGNADIAAGDDFPFELEIIDSAGNASNFFEGVITQDNDPIDANRPTISAVSIPDVAMSVGDAVTVSITAGEAGLTLTSGTINGVAVTGFTDNGAGNYSATYTVLEGHTDRAAGDAIPVSFRIGRYCGQRE